MAANLPAHIQARIAARQGKSSQLMDSMVAGEAYPRVSIKGSRFKLIDETGEVNAGDKLQVVFVGVNPRSSKVWYDKPYNPAQENVRPTCFSNDGLRPDASVEQPFHDNCAQCPNNVLGSRITPSGQQSKICNDVRYVAVVPSADPTKVYGLTIPVSSLKAFRQYFKDLKGYGLIPEEVVTTLSFDQAVSFPKLEFSHSGYVPEKHLGEIEKLVSSVEVKQVTRSVAAPQLQAPATRPAVENKAPATAAPSDEDVDDEEDVPPQTAPTPPPAPAKAKRGRPPKPKAAADTASGKGGGDPATDLEKELDSIFG